MTNESRLSTTLLIMLMGTVILLMVTIIGLFVRMNQLQHEVLNALPPVQGMAVELEMGLSVGMIAPDFTLSDTTGHPVSLSKFADQQVLLAFSSIQCPICTEMYPYLRTFSEETDELQVVLISRGSVTDNLQLVEEQKFTFTVLNWEDKVAKEYNVPGTPYFYVIDAKGTIADAGSANTLEQLKALGK